MVAARLRNLAAIAVRFGWQASPTGTAGVPPALLRPEARRTFLHAFESRLVTEFTPEGDDEPLSYRAFLLRQARQIRDLVRGARPFYSPLVLRA